MSFEPGDAFPDLVAVDHAVQQSRRTVLADPEPADLVTTLLVTTLLVDASHFGGSLTARRGPDATARLRDDPFRLVGPAPIASVEAGLLGVVPPPCGPVIERHGSDVPWPGGQFPPGPLRNHCC